MTTNKPKRPEIVNAETPQTPEGWAELIQRTVERFVIPKGKSTTNYHLSDRTFPGGSTDEESDEVNPLCKGSHKDTVHWSKPASVYPVGYIDPKHICDHCRDLFVYYHNEGKPSGNCRPFHNCHPEVWGE